MASEPAVEVDDYWQLRVRLLFGSVEVDVFSGPKTGVRDVRAKPVAGFMLAAAQPIAPSNHQTKSYPKRLP
jgi:hypothetical protein